VYEIAKELAKEHDVSIVSSLGGELVSKIEEAGVKCFDIKTPPNYSMGDGVKKIKDTSGNIFTSTRGEFYKVSNEHQYDLLLLNHYQISRHIVKMYDAPAVNIIHSEIIPKFEDPVFHPNIKKYVAVRPSIKEYLIDKWDIDKNKIEVIYNPIDTSLFNWDGVKDRGYYLFVGSYDYLRKQAIEDFIKLAKSNGKETYLVGRGYPDFNDPMVKTFEPVPPEYIARFTKECSCVGSVMLGRTAMEGFHCDKSAWIYDVDERGNIKKRTGYYRWWWKNERNDINKISKQLVK
jgi:glycosyltransferase involved in cell wall biosynthesis